MGHEEAASPVSANAARRDDLRHLAFGHAALAATSVATVIVCGTGPTALTYGLGALALAIAGISVPGWRRVLAPPQQDSVAGGVSDLERRRRIQAVLNAGDTLSVVFQPVIDLRSNQPVGWEALSRFAGDDRSPVAWFEEADAVGLAVELELLAVSRALDAAPGPQYVSINVGPETIVDMRFLELLGRKEHGPLVVELTEHAVIDDYTAVAAAIAELRASGVRVAVDDAGSGFSSLRHVISLAPDIIKLDQTLIASIDRDPRRRTLATSLASFAAEIGSDLIAEGIEREEELRVCEEIGIRYGQGFLLGRPGALEPR